MDKIKREQIIRLSINTIIAISTVIIALIGIIFGAGDGQLGTYIIGIGYFKPYTMDSNIMAGIAAILVVIYSAKSIVKKEDVTPEWVETFYLMTTVCVFLTLFIAATFLAPGQVREGGNYFTLFKEDMFFFHFLNPVLAVYTFSRLLKNKKFLYKDCIIGAIPTVIYSIIYLLMVVVFEKWEDFYNFTFGGQYKLIPIVLVVIYSLVLLFGLILIFLHNLRREVKEK